MRTSWPKATYRRSYTFRATHAMEHLGGDSAIPHPHDYVVRIGATHEIHPHSTGYTHALHHLDKQFRPLVQYLEGAHLNTVLPIPPSLEAVALWFLANTSPADCDSVEAESYGGYTVFVERHRQTSEWLGRFVR